MSPQTQAAVGAGRHVAPAHPRFLGAAVGILAVVQVAYAIVGLAVNPDFATGAEASSHAVLGVDFNGWHAVSGLLLFGPGLVASLRRTWARWYCLAVIAILVGTAGWGLIDDRPLGLLFFPDAVSDAVFHLASAAAFLAALIADHRLSHQREIPPGAAPAPHSLVNLERRTPPRASGS